MSMSMWVCASGALRMASGNFERHEVCESCPAFALCASKCACVRMGKGQ